MKCPGQDSRYWQSNAIFETTCTRCGATVEFFKDDTTRKCDKCGHRMMNPKMDFGCASYCEYAEQCLGALPQELLAQKEDLLKDRVAVEMKRHFRSDFRRIGHAMRAARHAEGIGPAEGGNLSVILCAAYLHDIGAPGTESPGIAREILTKLGAKKPLIDEVVDIVAHHHHPREGETNNFKIFHDAVLITRLEEEHKESPIDSERLMSILENSFLTENGRLEAKKTFRMT
jgi:hypothetical protein